MNLQQKIQICSKHYKKWKQKALLSQNLEHAKKAMEKAFFWLELNSAFLGLWAIEKLKGDDVNILIKLMIAKLNLSKKLVEYTEKILEEIRWKIR